MLHANIKNLDKLGNEIIYNDPLTGEVISGIIGKIEREAPNLAFVYIISPYEEENDKVEGVFKFKDIMVFDDRPDTEHGWHKNSIIAQSKSYINR